MIQANALFESYNRYLEANRPRRDELEMIESVTEYLERKAKLEEAWADQPVGELGGKTPAQWLAALDDPQAWCEVLIAWHEMMQVDTPLPEPVFRALEERVEQVGPRLIELMLDPEMAKEEAPGRGFVPATVAQALGAMKYHPAIPALMKVLEEVPEFTLLGDAAVQAVRNMGEPVREALLELADRHREDVGSVPYYRAVEILVAMGQDERTWQLLRHALQQRSELEGLYAVLAGEYGDKRAVYHLNAMLEERPDLSLEDQQACLESIELLDGIPTDRALGMVKEPDRPVRRKKEKIGRNDPCPCGSGKKYKKCCGR